jgi:hypothetical protein
MSGIMAARSQIETKESHFCRERLAQVRSSVLADVARERKSYVRSRGASFVRGYYGVGEEPVQVDQTWTKGWSRNCDGKIEGAVDDNCCNVEFQEELESNLTTTLYLLTILTKLVKDCTDEERFNVNRMVFTLNQMQVTLRDGQTLLHLACNSETPVDDFHTNDICKFPCAETTRLLINCGADVNAMDYERNTPLHVIVNYHKPISDFLTLHSIITDLTEAGAHLDCVNKRGETPLDSSATGVAEIILKTQMKLSLKCMAANAVKHHKLTYQGQVPQALESFIELHGPGIVKKA